MKDHSSIGVPGRFRAATQPEAEEEKKPTGSTVTVPPISTAEEKPAVAPKKETKETPKPPATP